MSILPDREKQVCPTVRSSMAACAMEADGDGRMSRGGDGPHPKYTYEYTNTPKDVYEYTHTGVRKVQMTMALFGAGRWRPLMDSLRATHSGTPCPLGRNPDERIWEIRKYAGKSELCPLSMNPLVVVRCGKSSE